MGIGFDVERLSGALGAEVRGLRLGEVGEVEARRISETCRRTGSKNGRSTAWVAYLEELSTTTPPSSTK